jgi:disulfide bond formation protein DsbB
LLLAVLLALALLALAYRYRDRLLALLVAPLAVFGTGGATSSAGRGRDPWANVDPSDRIDRAWYAMVRHLDVERPWAKTPDECRSAAVDAGLDPEAVRTLTRLFRQNRYASDGLSAARRERAMDSFERLDIEGRGR